MMQVREGEGFAFSYVDGIVHFQARGLWTPDIAERVHREMNAFYAGLRAKGLPIRIISDMTGMPPQPQEVTSQLDRTIQLSHRPEDRIALIVSSSLAKLQFRRIIKTPQVEMFVSVAAAKTWLLAHDGAAAA